MRQRFTGYQKDAETSLDFAEARMYANTYGRFTAVDPLLASGKSANPQTFNRYAYVLNNPLILTDPSGLQVSTKPDEEPIKVETQLSRKAPWVGNVRVTHNGRELKNDLFVGDQFTVTWKYRINKLDDLKSIQRASTISGVDRDRSTSFSNGKPNGTETEITEGNDSFSDAEGTKRLDDAKVVTVGIKNDEAEVTMSQTFEIIGRKDGTPGGSNQINFQITVVDPRAPLTPNRNSTNMVKGELPAKPAIFTTRTNDPRKEVTSDPSKAVSYRNRKRTEEEEEE